MRAQRRSLAVASVRIPGIDLLQESALGQPCGPCQLARTHGRYQIAALTGEVLQPIMELEPEGLHALALIRGQGLIFQMVIGPSRNEETRVIQQTLHLPCDL